MSVSKAKIGYLALGASFAGWLWFPLVLCGNYILVCMTDHGNRTHFWSRWEFHVNFWLVFWGASLLCILAFPSGLAAKKTIAGIIAIILSVLGLSLLGLSILLRISVTARWG